MSWSARQERPHPRLPIIKRLPTISYPAISCCIKKSDSEMVMDGGCPGRAHQCPQKSRAGKLSRSTARAAGKCCIPVCKRSHEKMGWGGHKFGVFSVNSWVCSPSHKELVWQYWLLGPQGTVCRSSELRQAGGGQEPVEKAFLLLFLLHCTPL